MSTDLNRHAGTGPSAERPTLRFESPVLDARGNTVSAWAAEVLLSAGLTAEALYVATSEAGARESLAFWSAAQEAELAFAAPGAFPWTLANSPAGRISVVLGITGPVTTLLGPQAWDQALEVAGQDVESRVAASVLVVRLDPAEPCRSGRPEAVRWVLEATLVGQERPEG